MDPRATAFLRLLDIMDTLRAECPWDRKQTMETLRPLTIEETYELGDAILRNDLPEVKKELGDLLLHMVFYARIGQEKNAFDITDVLNTICEKLIHRHPHIYGEVKVKDEEEVKANWERIKLAEKARSGDGQVPSVLEGVPRGLPSLVKAIRVQDKARGVGFDWEHRDQVWDKVHEELAELKQEVDAGSDKQAEELGDVLFSLVNYARFLGIDPDEALERTNRKFIRRFQFLERESRKDGKEMGAMSLDEMDAYWERAKDQVDDDRPATPTT
ncbi:MAG: nucleoside triphosphate pyrophosphohydrolase [Flavobacteriales bacterium]|nr:nucleoside triphosphate pyrophosphohydrolase [Flavobacteriales bacterium]MCB9178513.1 nucleoside triphosphate pyrophosphohydrolase [Flavobacteriales bacterium]HPF89644.1 nucleoside triphosphate pyrophosphohydrolase [Flavobacteriales bacterium]